MGRVYVSALGARTGGNRRGLLDVLNGMQNGSARLERAELAIGRRRTSPMTIWRSRRCSPGRASSILQATRRAWRAAAGAGTGPRARPGERRNARRYGRRPASHERRIGRDCSSGGAAGSILSGGPGDLLNHPAEGAGDQANSWVSNGPNNGSARAIPCNGARCGPDHHLSAQSGFVARRIAVGAQLYLPDAINHLTPDGRVPNEDELSGRI